MMKGLIFLLIAAGFALFYFSRRRGYRVGIWASYAFIMLNLLALLPIEQWGRGPTIPPSQIVYRFDEHRYLLLTGYRCEGAMDYIDEKEGIVYNLARHSARVPTFPYMNVPGDYIAIPSSDMTAIDVSRDGGRTFSTESFSNQKLHWKEAAAFSVVNGVGYVRSQEGLVYSNVTPQLRGYFQLSAEDSGFMRAYLDKRMPSLNITVAEPEVPKDYKGWRRMRCEYGAKGTQLANRLAPLVTIKQALLRGYSLVFRAFGVNDKR